MAAKDIFSSWVRRGKGMLGLWSILPPSILAVIGGYLSTGVHWISQYGAFGWFASGLVSFVLSAVGFGIVARSLLWRVEAHSRARTLGDSSPFDPMARIYENKRLYLRDLAPLGRKQVRGKTFINCEIIGPGTAILLLQSDPSKLSKFTGNNTFDVDCIEVEGGIESYLAIGFWDCDFVDCNFYHLSLLFRMRSNDSLHWITKDSRQPLLPAESGASSGLIEITAENSDASKSG